VSELWLIAGGLAVVSAVLCGLLAPTKNRPAGTWAFFGLVFGVFALLALAFVSKRGPETPQPRSNPTLVAVLAIFVIGAAVVMLAMLNGWP
jgi:uncharacterized membrane protein (DUF4010 family)